MLSFAASADVGVLEPGYVTGCVLISLARVFVYMLCFCLRVTWIGYVVVVDDDGIHGWCLVVDGTLYYG